MQVASEEIQFDAWGIDVVVGASQKGEPDLRRRCRHRYIPRAADGPPSPQASRPLPA